MAAVQTSNQSYATMLNKMYAYFQGGSWQFLYDRVSNAKAYLLNPNNASGLIYAYVNNGDPANVQGYGNAILWYYTAFYSNLYPLPAHAQASCNTISTAITALEGEIRASDKLYESEAVSETHNARNLAINNLLSAFNGMYTNLSCDTYLADVAQQKTTVAQQQALLASQQSAVSTYQQTAGASGGGTKVAVYVAIGSAVLIAFMVVKKMMKKS